MRNDRKLPPTNELKDMRSKGLTYQEIGDKYGVTRQAVQSMINYSPTGYIEKKLKHGEKGVYKFICTYFDRYGYYPMVREIMSKMNITDPFSISSILAKLKCKGLINMIPVRDSIVAITYQGENQ